MQRTLLLSMLAAGVLGFAPRTGLAEDQCLRPPNTGAVVRVTVSAAQFHGNPDLFARALDAGGLTSLDPFRDSESRYFARIVDPDKAPWILSRKDLPRGLESAQSRYLKVERDPIVDEPGPLPNGQWHRDIIEAAAAWLQVKPFVTANDPPLIGIMDTGVEIDHPALLARAWTNASKVLGESPHGVNFMTGAASTDLHDPTGHGTRVTGVIAGELLPKAEPVAPHARYITLPVSTDTCVDRFATYDAIDFLVKHKAVVANLSWKTELDYDLREAMRKADTILFVAAVPNDSKYMDSDPGYPAAYTLPNLISVTATDSNDKAPERWGLRIDIAAPGWSILTARETPGGGGLAVTSGGSSLAVPMVSATAALLRTRAPQWTAEQLRRYLIDSADYPPTWTGVGYGRLNARRATAPPVVIDWPNAQSKVNINRKHFVVRWHSLFASTPCRKLVLEIKPDAWTDFKPLQTVEAIDSEAKITMQTDFRNNAKLRMRCEGTQMITQEAEFAFDDLQLPETGPIQD